MNNYMKVKYNLSLLPQVEKIIMGVAALIITSFQHHYRLLSLVIKYFSSYSELYCGRDMKSVIKSYNLQYQHEEQTFHALIFGGEKMSKLTEVNLVENIIKKKKLLLELLPIMNVNERSHQEQRSNEYNGYREMTSVTHVSNRLCQQTALKFLPPLLQHAFHSFIHLFALSLISPSTVKVFFFCLPQHFKHSECQ